ncbi:uncharacterized protein LOC26527598 isoform X1 [Drosophila mojavensis]|uniref:Uncharacterized protein, isoform B n=1 Tax=Drosophila mojavensis TaxID=7230 RepID=A0A0Q9XHW1_DROMO|nr:uncharacterized protein LOC26527598 isoform X1 [Drosophila mojavensis]KRG03272.1 uncharacterized protein Dmoj_GI25957, isoform B [Drosophila mojavensis]
MDYFENAQIGGYRIEMPFPQLFYPEMNSVNKSFDQTAMSNINNCGIQSDFYDNGVKSDIDHLQGDGCNMNYHQRHVTNNPFSYRCSERQSRRAREMRARNGLYYHSTPNDGCDKRSEYPQYAGDPTGQSITVNSLWQ